MIYWVRRYFSDPSGHIYALYEVLTSAAFSLIPFIVPYFVNSAKRTDGSFMNMDDLVGRGQIYLLSYGVFGTIFWLAFLKAENRHGARSLFGLIATVLVLPILGFIGVDPTFSTVLNVNLVRYSYILYTILLILNYLLLFYINITPPNPGEVISREAGEMRGRWEELNRNG